MSRLVGISRLVLLGLSLAGCMLYPRNGQHVPAAESQVAFSGYVNGASVPIQIEGYDPNRNEWRVLSTAVTSGLGDGQSYRDNRGVEWYPWQTGACVPEEMWQPHGEHRLARVRSRVTGSSVMLTSFEDGQATEDCFSAHAYGTDARDACGSTVQPDVTLVAPAGSYDPMRSDCCGAQGQPACPGASPCRPGFALNWSESTDDNRCDAGCGHNHELACAEGGLRGNDFMFRYRCVGEFVGLQADGAACLCIPVSYRGPDVSDDSGTCTSAVAPPAPGEADDGEEGP